MTRPGGIVHDGTNPNPIPSCLVTLKITKDTASHVQAILTMVPANLIEGQSDTTGIPARDLTSQLGRKTRVCVPS